MRSKQHNAGAEPKGKGRLRAKSAESAAIQRRASQPLVGFALLILTITLIISFIGTSSNPVAMVAEGSSVFNNILNQNIGLHPQWELETCIAAKAGGVGDTYTNKHKVWRANVDGNNDVVMEKSPSYVFTGDESYDGLNDLAERYSLKKGNEVVFNITSADTAAKVWADAVAFALSLGEPTNIADDSLLTCAGGSGENHQGFRVGTNTGVRNQYKGNFFIKNDDTVNGKNVLGQYITVRLQDDWVAKDVTTTAPTVGKTGSGEYKDYLYVGEGSSGTLTTTSFNYISTSENETLEYLPTETSGYTRIQNTGDYIIAVDVASNSCNYDDHSRKVFNDSCAFSFGRINVPTGVYIVLDLNGHTIDRALTASTGNYYGSVIHIASEARLEIMDSTAYENASSARIEKQDGATAAADVAGYKTNKTDVHTTNHKGTITGGYTSGNTMHIPADFQAEMQCWGGGINNSMWADCVFHSGTIANNYNTGSGGAFYQRSKAAVTIYDGYVLDNGATGSGGVSNLGSGSGCPFTMYGGVLAYNAAVGTGGAVNMAESSYGNFHGGEIVYNAATGTAEVTYSSGKPTYSGCGGALCLSGNTLGILDSVTIANNKAANSGNSTVSVGEAGNKVFSKGGGGVFVMPQVGAVDTYWRSSLGPAFKFSGSLQIYNNTAGGKTDNIHLGYGYVGANFLPGLVGDQLGTAFEGYPKIGVGGSLFANGIVARVGVTLGNYNDPTFTKNYGAHNAGRNAFVYFFADDSANHSVINTDSALGASNEGRMDNKAAASESTITWVIKGTGTAAGNTNKDYTFSVNDNTVHWEGQGGISYTYEGLTCEFGMLKVNYIGAYSSYTKDNLTSGRLAYWEIASSADHTITNTFTETNFRFKLGEWDYVDGLGGKTTEGTRKGTAETHDAIRATDNTISYAGEYSFLLANGSTRYKNPSFKIRINQVGVEVGRTLYYNGKEIGKDKTIEWYKAIDWDGSGRTAAEGSDAQLGNELDQPYFIYSGDYYYPVLNSDWENLTNFRLFNPYTNDYTSVSKASFTGYVMQFTYANDQYFGKNQPINFGDHSSGGIEYQTMHRQPGEIAGIGSYVPGVMHAGMYQVSFISSRTAQSASLATADYDKTGVYFAANNFAFSSKINLYVEPASADVQLTDAAQEGFTYKGTNFADGEIVWFDNTSDTHVDPHIDSTAVLTYYLFDDLEFKAGIYDTRTDLYYTLAQIRDWENNRPYGSDEQEKHEKNPDWPYFTQYTSAQLSEPPTVKWDYNGLDTSAYQPGSTKSEFEDADGNIPNETDNNKMAAFEELYQKETVVDTTGKFVYIIDTASFRTAKQYKEGEKTNPLDARRYVVLIELDLEVGYDDYDYEFDQDSVQLVGLGGESQYFWAFEFDVNPAEVNPFEETVTSDGNTVVTITKDLYYKNVSYGYKFEGGKFAAAGSDGKRPIASTANLPAITFNGGTSRVTLALGQDYDVEFVDFAEKNDPEHDQYNFMDASVGPDNDSSAPAVDGYKFGDYNLAVKITFGGTDRNYINNPATVGAADDKGTAYEDGDGAFYIYFRIVPIIVTASANLTYTYDGGSYDRGRFLEATGIYSDWYESIFFLAQDSITTPVEIIENQKDRGYVLTYPEAPDGNRTIDDLWGGVEGERSGATYDDTSFYMNRYTIGDVNVQYTNSDFIANGIKLGVGMYAFQTGDPKHKEASFYHLTTIDFDNQTSIDVAPKTEGVMWLLTVGGTQSFASTDSDKTTATNFIINTQSYLNVTISQKNINGSDIDVKFNNAEYTAEAAEQEFPYAGVAYTPPVELSFTAKKPSDKPAAERPTETVKLTLYGAAAYDYFTTYNNNTTVSTDTAKAQVILTANKYNEAPTDQFSNNYYGSRTINFKIVPAHIKATIDGAREFVYDGTAKTLKPNYENVSVYNQDILEQKVGFTAPVPSEADIATQYKKLDDGSWGPNAPADAARYRQALYSSNANFMFEDTGDFKLFTEDDESTGTHRTVTAEYEITKRPVRVTVLGQSGVYGGNQHTSIGATENTHWRAESGVVGEGVVNNDRLGIALAIVYTSLNENSNQLNVGWYAVRASYNNPNYNVTFAGDNSGLNGALYIEEYESHNTSTATAHSEGDVVTAYDISNAYYIYARVISMSVQPQSITYNGKNPEESIDQSRWSAANIVNGNMPAIVKGDETLFNAAIKLTFVAPTDGELYTLWQKWGKWAAGTYSGKSGIQAEFKAEADPNITQNYKFYGDSELGALRIDPANLTVTYNGPVEWVYNNQLPANIDEDNYRVVDGEVYGVYKYNEERVTDGNEFLHFTFEYQGEDYSAGNHRIMGKWTEGQENPNYSVTFNPATYNVKKRALTVTVKDQYAIYGEKLWEGDNWWSGNLPNATYWSVEVTNANAGVDDGQSWVNDADRVALNILPDIKATQGVGKGEYQISITYTNSDNYDITVKGSWGESDVGANDGTCGKYVIHQRAIIVHINDQGGVYGSFSGGAPVDQSEGSNDKTGGWFVVGFDKDKQQDICGEHACDDPKEPFVLVSDALSISLTLGDALSATDGVYNNHKIVGHCGNDNYAVKFVGGEASGESEYKRGDYGIFGLIKRQVTVDIQNQSVNYGKLANGATTGFRTDAYSAFPTNDSINPGAFIASDNVRVELAVTVKYSADGRGNYNQAGKYAITVKIYEGDTLIYSSLEDDKSSVSASSKYELNLEGDYTDVDFAEGYKAGKVSGKTGAYEINKIELTVTVLDKSSVYGEPVVEWEFNMTGAMSAEESFIKNNVSLTIGDENEATWGGTRHDAGTYNISAKLENEIINNNYNVVFRTQYGTAYDEEGEPKVTATYTVTKRMLSVNVNRRGSVYGDELASLTDYGVSPVGTLTGPAIVPGDELGITLAIFEVGEEYNLSTSNHLKVGIYPIVGSWNDNPNYELTFAGTWSYGNTETWHSQRDENGSADLAAKHNEFDGHAGVYEVEKRNLTITLGTEKPHSEYGDAIVDFDGDKNINNKSWGYSYANNIEGDVISFEMTTRAHQGSDAKAYAITAAEGSYAIDATNDNENYNIRFTEGIYTVEPRKMSVQLTAKEPTTTEGYATDVYGTTYKQDKKFSYIFYRTGTVVGTESSGWYGSDRISLRITPIEAEGFRITETGFYPVGQYMLKIEAVTEAETNNANYVFTDMDGISMRYVVTKRPITIYINEQESVFGETIDVHQGQGEGPEYGWHVISNGDNDNIVKGNGKVDDLGITITKDAGDRWTEKGYMLSARATNGNYNITWKGNWEDGKHGTYTIKKRLLLIRIHNQYSIYGESVRVSSETSAWEVVDPATVGGDVKYYTLLDGQTPDITLNIYTTVEGGGKIWYTRDASTAFSGTIGRGEYHIGVQFIGNPDYDIKVEEDYLPDVNDKAKEQERKDLITEFPDDFGETTTLKTVEVKTPVISQKLAESNNATYFVTIRPVTIKINDQSGVYGDYLELNSSGEGASPAYTIELGKYLGDFVTTGQPFVGEYTATFDLVTTAFVGSDITGEHPVGKKAGWSLAAGQYPIFGEAYHVFMGGRAVADNSYEAARLSHNYQFNFEGAYLGDETYLSGNTFKNRAGVYTVEKRQISLTATNGSAIYGGVDTVVLRPTLDQSNYTAINGNSKNSSYGGVTHGPIISDDDKKALHIRLELVYEPENLSHSGALKAGHYTIRLDYDENANYEVTKVNNGDFEVLSRQASILIVQSAATATYLAAIPSEWAVKAIGEYGAMYQLSNVLDKDIIAFTMTTEAVAGNSVGSYALNGRLNDASADNDNGNYSITFTPGTFEITKKKVDVKILDQSSVYGETVNVNAGNKWELPVGWNVDDVTNVTNNDDAAALGITLSSSANDRTDAGRYQISGSYDINGEVGKNYDLNFVGSWNSTDDERTDGDGGTLTITPREIVVVIKAQEIVYRDNIAVDQKGWFAWRENHVATWAPDGSTVNDYGVLGPKDGLDALNIILTKGGATDVETYGPETGVGTYVGKYAIVGSSITSNYSIRFAYERINDGGLADESFDYSGVERDEDGVFTIKPYDITINISTLGNDNNVRYGGTEYVKNGGKLYFGAELVNDKDVVWSYADEEKTFLPNELGYLSFRLGGEFSSEVYAFVGSHPIVGYWGYGLTNKNAADYRMQFNYNVTFKGNWTSNINDSNKEYGYDALYENSGKTSDLTCGVIKIVNAQIDKKTYDQSYEEGKSNGNWHGENWNRETAFSGNRPENLKHSMAVGADDLLFAGNVLFGGNSVNFGGHANSKLAEAVKVSYSNLQHDGALQVWADAGVAPEEQDVGKWTVDVAIEAPYHDAQTFTLTLTITRIDITIYLNTNNIEIPYGYYKLRGNEITPANVDGKSLNDWLKELLFKVFDENLYLDKSRPGGAITSAGVDEIANADDIVAYLLDSVDVQLSISTRSTDASTGEYLIAQRYVLTISAGENMAIRFGNDYNNVRVMQKALSATWTPSEEPVKIDERNDRPEYVYTFNNKDISVVPRVTDGDILAGDLVLSNGDISAFSYNIYKVNDDGGEERVSGNSIRDYGTYRIVIIENLTPTPGQNVDIGNYTTPVGEDVYVVINRATVTIFIEDQSNEYGDSVNLNQLKWWVYADDPIKDVPDGDHPNTVPGTSEDIRALGISLSFAKDANPFNADSYAIYGSATTTNYIVVFKGNFEGGNQGLYKITPRNVKVKVSNFSFVYGTELDGRNLADDTNQYKYVHTRKVDGNDVEVESDIAVRPGDDIGLKITVAAIPSNFTPSEYLKVGTYGVAYATNNNANYNITFADESGHLQNAGNYEVKVEITKRSLTVSIHGRQNWKYGATRPTMPENYNIINLAENDAAYYEANGLKDRPSFITFSLYDAATRKPLEDFDESVEERMRFDPVGVYIIIGELVEDDDIGDNYEVEFKGEWSETDGGYSEYVGKAGKYEVIPRSLGVVIYAATSVYGDSLADIDFDLMSGIAENTLAGNDTKESLHLDFVTDRPLIVNGKTNNVGVYKYAGAISKNPNYTIGNYYALGDYTITKREITIEALNMSHPYGDNHSGWLADAAWKTNWQAHRADGKDGDGIAYSEDAIVGQIKLIVSGLSDKSAAGEYTLSYTQDGVDPNYTIVGGQDAIYKVTPRKVRLNIFDQSGEYGEHHAVSSEIDRFGFVLLEGPNSNKDEAVPFIDDKVMTTLRLFLVNELGVDADAGDYLIDASFTDGNYDVTIAGNMTQDEREYGKYTVTPRKIVVIINADQSSEYGDQVVPNSAYNAGWTAIRPEGYSGAAIVNGDELGLTLSVRDSRGNLANETSPIGKYALYIETKISDGNYDVEYRSEIGGEYEGSIGALGGEILTNYTIVQRKIIVEFGGTSEYGDKIEVGNISYRADGKEGPAIVNGDDLGYSWTWRDVPSDTDGNADAGEYRLTLNDNTTPEIDAVRRNYDITTAENSRYIVTPRKVTVRVLDDGRTYGDPFVSPEINELLEVTRTTLGATGEPILHNDIQFFSLSVIDGDDIAMTDGRPYYAGVYNYSLIYTPGNTNYDIVVEYGHYTVAPKPITVNINTRTTKYSGNILDPTFADVEGVLAGDELNIMLSVIWGTDDLIPAYHNAGTYAIKGVWNNPNYAVTFHGDLGEYGAYVIEKADNTFTKKYDGNGTVYLGDDYRDGDLPTALWGNDGVRYEYYLDEAMTQRVDVDGILNAPVGEYYVKAIVDEGINWTGAATTFFVRVIDSLGFSDGLDITAYVCIYASQILILLGALIFVRRKKDKNKKTNTSKAGN